jgi:hypothetical protein
MGDRYRNQMGILNLDNYVASNGVQKTGVYISFANETIYVRQAYNSTAANPAYTVNANYRIFWDQQSREGNLSFIDLKSVNACVSQSMLSESMYACLYAELKKIYPNYQDVFDAGSTGASGSTGATGDSPTGASGSTGDGPTGASGSTGDGPTGASGSTGDGPTGAPANTVVLP